jgi:histidine ammonia-lyase
MLKLMRMRQALDVSRDMLGQDLLNAAFWMDLRKLENPDRTFGPGPTAVWSSFRKVVPFREPAAQPSFATRDDIAAHFLQSTSPASFYSVNTISMPSICSRENTSSNNFCR